MSDILSRVAFVTTYPPRPCGIATFSQDLIKSFDSLHTPEEQSVIFALKTDTQLPHVYPPEVVGVIGENTTSDYDRAADTINSDATIRLVSIQHEFGIFGERFGERIIGFLSRLEKPVVITFHTVLPEPSAGMRQVVQKILDLVQCVVVMTTSSKIILQNLYQVTPEKIVVIPHGIHEVAFTDGREAKERLGLSGYKILSTFGLLGEGKGVEYGIAALPKLVRQIPNVRYLIVGATHPVVLARHGENYRNKLRELAQKLGVAEHVIFYNQYFSTSELLTFLQATDVYLALSQNPDQAVSGTLSYALGAGRPVIATAFRQAKEMIVPTVGRLIPFGESETLSNAAHDLIVTYMEKYPNEDFKGLLYVFDGRVTMGFNVTDPKHEIVGKCELCGTPSERYVDCAYTHCRGKRHILCCETCSDTDGTAYCSVECKQQAV
jgi:glycosyltransferase involved in cell wall biosynthesis